jgi:hypothetical protein
MFTPPVPWYLNQAAGIQSRQGKQKTSKGGPGRRQDGPGYGGGEDY